MTDAAFERDMIAYLRERGYTISKARAPRVSNRSKRHRHCAEHVRVDGFQEAVCILVDQDRAEVIAFAESIAAIARHERTPYAIAA